MPLLLRTRGKHLSGRLSRQVTPIDNYENASQHRLCKNEQASKKIRECSEGRYPACRFCIAPANERPANTRLASANDGAPPWLLSCAFTSSRYGSCCQSSSLCAGGGRLEQSPCLSARSSSPYFSRCLTTSRPRARSPWLVAWWR